MVIVLGIITLFLMRGAYNVVQKDKDSKRNLEIAQRELGSARAKQDDLAKNIALLNTQAGVESEIRQKYNVSKEGEQVAVIIQSTASTTPVPRVEKGFWASLSAWFTHVF